MVENDCGRSVRQGDVDGLVAAIDGYAGDPAGREAAGDRARRPWSTSTVPGTDSPPGGRCSNRSSPEGRPSPEEDRERDQVRLHPERAVPAQGPSTSTSGSSTTRPRESTSSRWPQGRRSVFETAMDLYRLYGFGYFQWKLEKYLVKKVLAKVENDWQFDPSLPLGPGRGEKRGRGDRGGRRQQRGVPRAPPGSRRRVHRVDLRHPALQEEASRADPEGHRELPRALLPKPRAHAELLDPRQRRDRGRHQRALRRCQARQRADHRAAEVPHQSMGLARGSHGEVEGPRGRGDHRMRPPGRGGRSAPSCRTPRRSRPTSPCRPART